jgi:hypothetical protein
LPVLPASLHRLTRLDDDPAAGWLEPIDRAIIMVKGWAVWPLYLMLGRVVFFAFHHVIATASGAYDLAQSNYLSIPGLLTAATMAALIQPTRRFIVRVRARAVAKMAREAAERAAPIDDLAALEAEPDDRVVSLVGWVRGTGYVDHPVGGQRAIGLALPCQDGLPFVMETLHNFELVDEAGNAALVITGAGRLLGPSNAQLSRASVDDRQLLHSLNLPPTTVPTDWNALVVRDGDPVLVVGAKTTIQDLSQLQFDRAASRPAVASTRQRPLLVFPLDAERREV